MPRLLLLTFSFLAMSCSGQVQEADPAADTGVKEPGFPIGQGPRLLIDAAHSNYHIATGRFAPFAQLARNDGFVVGENTAPLSLESLSGVDILVIANAKSQQDGSAFRPEEIGALRTFVQQGGSLLLIADHTPYPSAVQELARAFSIHFQDVYAEDGGRGLFSRRNGGLGQDTLTQGIDQVRSFAGSAFTVDGPHRPLLIMQRGWTIQHMIDSGLSAKASAEGLLQGAVFAFGAGRVAAFGEAAMFTAQTVDDHAVGFHAKHATGNKQWILNLLRWLGHAEE